MTNVLQAMAALAAARDFGMEPSAAAEVAIEADGDLDRLIDGLAGALVAGRLAVPATPPA